METRGKVHHVLKFCGLPPQGRRSGIKLGDADYERWKELKDVSKIMDLDVPEVNNYGITHSPYKGGLPGK